VDLTFALHPLPAEKIEDFFDALAEIVAPFGVFMLETGDCVPLFLEQDDPMEEEENRIAGRQRVLKGGTIEFGGGAIDCRVRNISATGAALDVTSPVGIPTQFTLVTEGNHLPCRVVWRKEKRIGVAFEKP
jgi:PilZ domain